MKLGIHGLILKILFIRLFLFFSCYLPPATRLPSRSFRAKTGHTQPVQNPLHDPVPFTHRVRLKAFYAAF
jgi:hypothetical protein